jgi:hypothetical protein
LAEDLALQRALLPLVSATTALNFEGISANGAAPPDTNGSVGATQFVQIVNTEYAVYDKTDGGLILGPTAIHNIWDGFRGDSANGDGGDPVVLYGVGLVKHLCDRCLKVLRKVQYTLTLMVISSLTYPM